MLYKHFNEEMVGLQGIKVKKVENKDTEIIIYAESERKAHKCPKCGKETDSIHDYRKQKIKDIEAFGKEVSIILRKRRYRCAECGKRFYESNSFLPKYQRMTNRLVAFVMNKLRSERSFTDVAKETHLSINTVIRIFDTIIYPKATLPEVLSIDEFKGNTWGEKYQCILTDPVNKVVLDILPERYQHYLTEYFRKYSKEERNQVKFFVSDMWKTYSDISSVWFHNARRIVDKYHWIRQAIWAFENVRKEEQKKFGKTHRRYFKNSRKLLTKRFNELKDEQKQQVLVMLDASANLSRAHWYKEEFFKIIDSSDPKVARTAMIKWITDAQVCGILQFEKCAATMQNWFQGIVNSFDVPYTNGFTEGCNNKIKVLKRNAYGFRNFYRFRNRILHMFSHQKLHKQQTAA